MNKRRLTRKEIKHDIREDEVQTFLSRVFLTLQERPSLIVGIVVGVMVLALLATGAYALLDNRRQAAQEELAEALKVVQAPLADEAVVDPVASSGPRFANAEERRQRAREELEKVRGGAAGDIAELLLADIALEEGDAARAREIWERFLDRHEDHALAIAVRLNLIRLDRDEGRATELATELAGELEAADKSLPEDVLIYELARTREVLGETDAARELYQRLIDEHPQSPYAGRARQQLS